MPCDLKVLKYLTLLLIGLPSFGWSQKVVLKEPFDPVKTPSKPDYSNLSCWAALPEIKDCSDTFAGKEKVDCYSMKTIDVFFIHPTSFTYEPRGVNLWNGDIKDSVLNAKTDFGSIRYQASVFSGLANIYAPRYRQAHYYAYLTPDTASSNRAFNLAYEDVKNAFEHYLEHYHNGKGIILASHSQGTTHAIKLLKEMFDDKPLAKYLVAAYLVGMPVYDSVYTKLKPCTNSSETGCYLSWRTYAVNYFPENYVRPEVYSVCTNPLTWKINGDHASADLNRGGILRNMEKVIPELCDARVADGVLRIHKPNIRGKMFLSIKNYHIADYNLFYMNIHENAEERIQSFQGK